MPVREDVEDVFRVAGEAAEEVFGVILKRAAEPGPGGDLFDAVDGADFVLVGGGQRLGKGNLVAADDAERGGGGIGFAVEEGLVDGEEEGQQR